MLAVSTISIALNLCLSAAVIALFALCRQARARHACAEARLERMQDEIWEMKSAAEALNKAEAANEAKSRFLATVSHEFRTPLNGILGMADLLGSTSLSAEQTAYVSAIRVSGDALSSLINELLDFSRIEAGKLELKNAQFDLAALVEGVVELLAPRAQGKGLDIASIVSLETPRRVIGDAGRLRQVLINLAGNAVKFTESGGVGVEVALGDSGKIRFSIQDTGPGIAVDRRKAIFEDFEQGDGSASRHHEGTGLGLAISRRIVEMMGGDLRLDSTSASGSYFCFEIALPTPQVAVSLLQPAAFVESRRILLVTAAPFAGVYLARRLDDFGGQVEVVPSCIEAEARMLGGVVLDLVIVDCALGEETSRKLSKLARERACGKCLVLFSPFERREFGEALLQEFDGWLVKPVRLESVMSKLERPSPGEEGLAQSKASLSHQVLQGRNILLAEDNDVNALLVERHLQKLGAEVRRARDGLEAVDLATESLSRGEKQFDGVLMDIRMPGMDGLEAARKIRAEENSRNMPPMRIIALTANAFDEDREAALEAGMDDFLTKPVDLQALAAALISFGGPKDLRHAG